MSVTEKAKELRSAENPQQVSGWSREMVRHKVNVREYGKLFGVEVMVAIDTEPDRIDS